MPELFPHVPFTLNREPGRTQPRLLMTRFCIWREPGDLIREITLRQGINIIWSPDSKDRQSPIGHGAGKTTFCRLLRYCLGEKSFGSRDQQNLIHSAFPKGQVGLELMLNRERWAVLRSITNRSRDTVLQNRSLEELQAANSPTGIEPLLRALQDQLALGLGSLMPGGVGELEVWLAVLAWLSRDQECRFGHALNWRHPSTDSLSPVRDLSKEQRLQVVRAVIGSFTTDEYAAQAASDSNSEEIAKLTGEIEALDRQIQRIQITLKAKLGSDIALGIGELDMQMLEARARERFPEASALQSVALREARRKANARFRESNRRLTHLRAEYKSLETQIGNQEEILRTYRGQLAQSSRGIALAENEGCPICNVPLNQVLETGCRCTADTGYLENVRARRVEVLQAIEEGDSALADQKRSFGDLKKHLPIAEAQDLEAQRENKAAEEAEERCAVSSGEGSVLLVKLQELSGLLTERANAIDKNAEGTRMREEGLSRVQVIRKQNETA